jgi:hypothetical protein
MVRENKARHLYDAKGSSRQGIPTGLRQDLPVIVSVHATKLSPMQVDILKSLSPSTILIVAGLVFLLIGIVGEIVGKVKAETRLQRITLSGLGLILIVIGVLMSLRSVPPSPVTGLPQPSPSVFAPSSSATPITPFIGNPNAPVWVNTNSRAYHCFGDYWYGKTKHGKPMTQKEAWDGGNRPSKNKSCP